MDTVTELSTQWSNPSDVTTVLMVIGGDVIQKALAESTGTYFTPVCFSFGWISYAFMTIVSIVGEGRLLPPPDFPVKVFNLESGYHRENRNWVIGRVLRDHEASISRDYPISNHGIRIAVFEATENHQGPTKFPYTRTHVYGLMAMLLQLVVASIPIILNRDWGIMLITAAGTLMALIAGALPQWKAEKLPNRQKAYKTIALTKGNGSRDVMIIKGLGWCLDLEELAGADSPRHGRPWEKFSHLSDPRPDRTQSSLDDMGTKRTDSGLRVSKSVGGFPTGFWITRVVCAVQSVLWLLLLISVAALKQSSWFLVAVGAIGMFQNAFVAGMERDPIERNLPLVTPPLDVIRTRKVMDGLMDLEVYHGCGRHLVEEFFPKALQPAEEDWWKGNRKEYDDKRQEDLHWRGTPRGRMPSFRLHSATRSRDGRIVSTPPPQSQAGEQKDKSPAVQVHVDTSSNTTSTNPPAHVTPSPGLVHGSSLPANGRRSPSGNLGPLGRNPSPHDVEKGPMPVPRSSSNLRSVVAAQDMEGRRSRRVSTGTALSFNPSRTNVIQEDSDQSYEAVDSD
ncbi:hypothetical protein B0T19DRAFT_420254 [Cercophora scortea]|uniref:Uncharacterized protein n=1 Tax=Cercophora scortea TaxID=314031 RepID=A0AAE0IZM5_9PEZI|nr:hypothetical protein B0T19DRAFT_420254 [Cercophora scortea]